MTQMPLPLRTQLYMDRERSRMPQEEVRRLRYLQMQQENQRKDQARRQQAEAKIAFQRQQAMQQQESEQAMRMEMLRANLGAFSDAANNQQKFGQAQWLARNDNQQAAIGRQFAAGESNLDRRMRDSQFNQGLELDREKLGETRRQYDVTGQRRDNEFNRGMDLDSRKMQQQGMQFMAGLDQGQQRIDNSSRQFNEEQKRLRESANNQMRFNYDRMGQDEKQSQRELEFRAYDAEANRGMRGQDLDARIDMFQQSQNQRWGEMEFQRKSRLEDENAQLDLLWQDRLQQAEQGSRTLSPRQIQKVEALDQQIERVMEDDDMLPHLKLQAIKKFRTKKLAINPQSRTQTPQEAFEKNSFHKEGIGEVYQDQQGKFQALQPSRYTPELLDREMKIKEGQAEQQKQRQSLETMNNLIQIVREGGTAGELFARSNEAFGSILSKISSEVGKQVSQARQNHSPAEAQQLNQAARQALAQSGTSNPTDEQVEQQSDVIVQAQLEQQAFKQFEREFVRDGVSKLTPGQIMELQERAGDWIEDNHGRIGTPAEINQVAEGMAENILRMQAGEAAQPREDPGFGFPEPPGRPAPVIKFNEDEFIKSTRRGFESRTEMNKLQKKTVELAYGELEQLMGLKRPLTRDERIRLTEIEQTLKAFEQR